jgi:hypothetical protein
MPTVSRGHFCVLPLSKAQKGSDKLCHAIDFQVARHLFLQLPLAKGVRNTVD